MLKRGDMVRGLKPWNRGAIVGIIVKENAPPAALQKKGTYEIFWVNPKDKVPLNFTTWEVSASICRIDGEKELDKK